MATLALAATVIGAAGTAISAITTANQQRSAAKARQVQGEQDLAAQKTLLRRQLGEAAVSASASGLLGGSFDAVFTSQAIADANFLGQIKQRTDFEVKSLKNAAKSTLLTGAIGAGTQLAGGIAGARQAKEGIASARAARERFLKARPGSRLRPGTNPFGPNRGTSGTQAQLNIFSQTGF